GVQSGLSQEDCRSILGGWQPYYRKEIKNFPTATQQRRPTKAEEALGDSGPLPRGMGEFVKPCPRPWSHVWSLKDYCLDATQDNFCERPFLKLGHLEIQLRPVGGQIRP